MPSAGQNLLLDTDAFHCIEKLGDDDWFCHCCRKAVRSDEHYLGQKHFKRTAAWIEWEKEKEQGAKVAADESEPPRKRRKVEDESLSASASSSSAAIPGFPRLGLVRSSLRNKVQGCGVDDSAGVGSHKLPAEKKKFRSPSPQPPPAQRKFRSPSPPPPPVRKSRVPSPPAAPVRIPDPPKAPSREHVRQQNWWPNPVPGPDETLTPWKAWQRKSKPLLIPGVIGQERM